MIKIKKNEVKIKVPKKEKNKEAFLIAELGVALIEVAKYLGKDREEILSSLNLGVLLSLGIDEALKDLKECIKEGEDG